MKNRKFGEYTISDQTPREGDRVICIQKLNVNFGAIEMVNKTLADFNAVDTKNWKVIVDSKQEVTVDNLLKFKEEQEIVYASHFGRGINKKIVLTLSGGYKVYDQGEVVLETMTPSDAVKKYNLI